MDFFARQQQVRRLSLRLVALFVLAVVGIVVVVNLAVLFAFNAWGRPASELTGLILLVSAVTVAGIGLAALYRTATLRGGGGRVARELGGELVPQDTADPALRRLRNVVEEIAIASGVPVPEVYLLREESSINAFAAGWSTSDAAVAVTRGALDRLNRDELQGVIAHEFSHVVNGDMRLNIRLMGLLFGILFLSVAGRVMLQAGFVSGGRSRDSQNGPNPLPLVGGALLIAGSVGVLAGRLIKASVSRQREYLADASAVQFTRQTTGLAGALKKIGGLPAGSKLRSAKSEEVGHMLFGAGERASWFATHPPLAARITALDPTFDPAELTRLSEQWAASPPSGMAEDAALGLAPAADSGRLPGRGTGTPVHGDFVVGQVGAASGTAFRRAETLIDEIPAQLLDRARRGDTVVPLLFGLLMSDEPSVRSAQHATLARSYGPAVADAARDGAAQLAALHPLLRLPLAELAFPALRHRSQRERQDVVDAVFALIHADGRITVFEYCLSRLLYAELYESLYPHSGGRPGSTSLRRQRGPVTVLLAVLAAAGGGTPQEAARAFAAGIALVLPEEPPGYEPPPRGVTSLEGVWTPLDGLAPDDKALLVRAVVATISKDGVMVADELELLRTVCALLHCPLPPLG